MVPAIRARALKVAGPPPEWPVPLLRSSFEAVLALEYILESDYRQRSLAWLVSYIHPAHIRTSLAGEVAKGVWLNGGH